MIRVSTVDTLANTTEIDATGVMQASNEKRLSIVKYHNEQCDNQTMKRIISKIAD